MKKYGKTLTKENEIIANEIKELAKRIKTLKEEEREQFDTMRTIKGKYAIGTVKDDRIDMHYIGIGYMYATEENKAKEEREEKDFYEMNIHPIREEIIATEKKKIELENVLCFAINGCDIMEYNKRKYREECEKEIARLQKELRG